MRKALAALVIPFAVGSCNGPAVQGFGPSKAPTPDPPIPEPVLYRIAPHEVIRDDSPRGSQVRFIITLEVTHNGNTVAGAAVYLWVSGGTLLAGSTETTDAVGQLTFEWLVGPRQRNILSACATQSTSPPCQPRVVVVRLT